MGCYQPPDLTLAALFNTLPRTDNPCCLLQFIAELMHTQPVALVDPYSGRTHIISPTQLATGVLTVREELSRHIAKSLPGAVAAGTVAVLRRHLETHTYVSGTNAAPRASYRQYRRPRPRGPRWSQMSNS